MSAENLYNRNTGRKLQANQVRARQRGRFSPNAMRILAVQRNVAALVCLEEQIAKLERDVKGRISLRPEYRMLLGTPGIGAILGMTIVLHHHGRRAYVPDTARDLLATVDLQASPMLKRRLTLERCYYSIERQPAQETNL